MPTIDELTIQFKGKGVTTIVKNINALAGSLESLANKSQNLNSANISALAGALGELKGKIPTKTQVTNLNNLADSISKLNTAAGNGNITTFATDISTVSTALNNIKGTPAKDLDRVTNSIRRTGEEAKKTAGDLGKVAESTANIKLKTPKMPTINSSSFTDTFERTNQHLEKSYNIVSKFKQSLIDLKTFVPTNKMKSLKDETEKVRQKYEELRASMIEMTRASDFDPSSKAWESKGKELDALRQKYNDLIQKQRELAQEGDGFKVNPNFGRAYQGITTAVNGAKQAFGGIASSIQSANKYVNSFIGRLLKIGSATRRAKKNTVSYTESIKKLGKELTRVTKMLKLMITRMALRKVIEEVGNGFKSLALHSQEFDQNMSNLINSSKTLGYSVAGMAGQLLNALAPVLLQLIALITRAVNALNQLFSALRGLSTWNKAKDFTGNWSDSIKAANKQAKELKKTVLGFDELNQLQDKKSSGGDTSGNIVDMFEDVPIDPWFKDLSEKIKEWASKLFEPIKNAWGKLGEWVKAKWKYALDEVLKLGNSIARDFWKVWAQPETEQIFKNILIIIGEIGRTIGNLAKQFRKAWDENETGLHILEAIRDIVLIITNHLRNMATATADWAATLDFAPLLTSIKDWLESLKPAIDAIMGVLEDFYKEVVLKFTKWVIESGLPALIDVFTRFNQEVDWEGLRSKLAELWKHLEPFMETVGEGLIIFVERITTALADFINGEQFESFLKFLEDWMDSVTPEDVAYGIEKLIKSILALKVAGMVISAISALAPIIGGIVTACKGLASVASGVASFASAIGGLGTAILPIVGIAMAVATAIYSLIQSYGGLEELINKIKETVGNVVDAIKQKAESIKLTDKIDKFKESLQKLGESLGGLKSFWDTVFFFIEKTATFISVTILPLIKDLIKWMTAGVEIVSSLVQVFGGVFDTIVGIVTGDGEKIKQGVSNIWEGVKGFFKGGLDWIVALLNSAIDLILAPFKAIKYYLIGDPIVVDMWEGIKKIFSDSIGKVVNFVTKLKDDVVKFFTELAQKVAEKIADIKAKFTEWADKVKETKENIKTAIAETLSSISEKIGEIRNKVEEFKEDWAQKWEDAKAKIEEFKQNVTEHLDALKETFIGFKDKIAEAFSKDNWTFDGVADGLKETFKNAKEAIGSVWNGIADKLNGEHEIGSSKIKINLPKLQYANGGFPEDGLFFANHNELVGGFSNGKTAVANNAQIVSGIERGVYSAVSAAMATQSGNSSYISNEILVDGEVIARTITKAQEKQNRRYSPQTV